MVKSFSRSLSFPKPTENHHIRSTSLPCRSHPLISHICEEIDEIRSWSGSESVSSRICDGFTRLKAVHDSLDDLLRLPQSRDLFRMREFADFIEDLLEDLLRMVDVYGKFRTLALALKDECSAAEMACRKKDDSKIDLHLKNLSRVGREIGRLVPNLRSLNAAKSAVPAVPSFENESKLVESINGVFNVTILASVTCFGELSALFGSRKNSLKGIIFWNRTNNRKIEGGIHEIRMDLRRKGKEGRHLSKKLKEWDECVGEIQVSGGSALRSLINTRVSLLNLLTQ